MLWRPSAGGALRALDSDGPPRTRLGRPLLRSLGIPGGIYRAAAAGDSHIHCAARGCGAHAARTVSSLYVSGIMAVVLRTGILRHEARRELARVGQVLPKIRRRDWGGGGGGRRLFCLDALAE